MKVIFGLGNPGEKYVKTRHNFGFRAVESFREQFEFPEFRLEKKFKAEVTEHKVANKKVLLVRPQTFMNLSGESASALLNFYKPHLDDFLVIHDDVDLPFKTIRFREGGSSGGHNGIKNLIQHFGTGNFQRVKLGIASELLSVMPTEEFVLAKFSPNEEKAIPEILKETNEKIEKFISED